jgi:hypothetical protein
LDDTYSETLQRIYSQPADTVELAEIVLFWVVCARENLTVTQLQHMYAMQELEDGMPLEDDDLPDGEILTGACGGLISVDSESQTIQVIHYTVQQYFEASLGPKLMTARLSLAKVSLAYLGLSNFSSGFCSTDAAMLRRLKEYPFIEYAAKHWGSDMGLLDTDQLWPDVKRLLSDLSMIEMISQAWSISNARYPNWSQEFPRNSPGLVLAAAFDLPDMLREMVANGHDIEASGTDRETAVIRAAAFGHTENVRVLIQLGAAVNAEDYMSETALLKAARKGHAGVIQELIDGGADVNNKLSNHWTPLMSAVSSGNLETVRMLAEAGAELMAETKWGDSALSVALRSGQENIALFLADSGAILPRGVAGRRAPIIASQRGFEGLVRRLTIDYRAIAERPLQRQSPRIMSGVAETMEQTTLEGPSDSQTEAQTIGEVSFGELMEQYDIKTNFHRRYTVLEQIGKGHFATVYLCRSRVTGVTYAVKIFGGRGTRLVSSDFEGLRSEIEVLRELQRHHHPNLMRMVDIFAEFETSGVHLVLELAPRGELFNFIVDQSKLTETETRVIFTQLFSAVQFLVMPLLLLRMRAGESTNAKQHSHGWVHRDIKPENILLLDNNLRIRLSDFGLAKKIRSGSRSDELTATLCGTPSCTNSSSRATCRGSC